MKDSESKRPSVRSSKSGGSSSRTQVMAQPGQEGSSRSRRIPTEQSMVDRLEAKALERSMLHMMEAKAIERSRRAERRSIEKQHRTDRPDGSSRIQRTDRLRDAPLMPLITDTHVKHVDIPKVLPRIMQDLVSAHLLMSGCAPPTLQTDSKATPTSRQPSEHRRRSRAVEGAVREDEAAAAANASRSAADVEPNGERIRILSEKLKEKMLRAEEKTHDATCSGGGETTVAATIKFAVESREGSTAATAVDKSSDKSVKSATAAAAASVSAEVATDLSSSASMTNSRNKDVDGEKS